MTPEAIQQALERLVGMPLTKATRQGLTQYFHFGHTHYTTPQGLILDVGELTLAVSCPWQLQLPDGSTIKHSDVYVRKREAGLPTPVWDWKKPGSSLLDQRLMGVTNANSALEVAQTAPQASQGFMLYFSDGSALTVVPDSAQPNAVQWQVFSNTDDFSFAVGPPAE